MAKKIPPELAELIDEGIIDEIKTQLLSGKEASIYIVERDEEIFAAKVYKARNDRSFKNVASYVEGRNQTRNSRDKRAQKRKTGYGRDLMEADWRSMEHDALQRAFDAGVRVPEPFLLVENILIMELLRGEDGGPAPRLADIEIPHEVAALLHEEVFHQVRRLLTCGLIHGDLSAYNVLLADNGLNLIDLPQAVDASGNSEARMLLCRDLRNVTEFFAKADARLEKFVDCGEALFEHYRRGTLEEVTGPEAKKGAREGRRRQKRQRTRVDGRDIPSADRSARTGSPKGGRRSDASREAKRGPRSGQNQPRGQNPSRGSSGERGGRGGGPAANRPPQNERGSQGRTPPAQARPGEAAQGDGPPRKKRRRRRRRPKAPSSE